MPISAELRQYLEDEIDGKHNPPSETADSVEAARIHNHYNSQVSAVAFRQGDQKPRFVARFAELIAERADAAAVGDDDGVRSAERRLDRHTGVPYPQVPDAAWATADLLPAATRDAEYSRLERKYGPRSTAEENTHSRRRGDRAI